MTSYNYSGIQGYIGQPVIEAGDVFGRYTGPGGSWEAYFTITGIDVVNTIATFKVYFFDASDTVAGGYTYYTEDHTKWLNGIYTPISAFCGIAGRITYNGAALSGVSISPFSSTTNSNGEYVTNSISKPFTGVVTPSKSGYFFIPSSRSYSSLSSFSSDWDYVASRIPAKPVNPNPPDEEQNVFWSDKTISWENGGDATSYNIYFGVSGNLISLGNQAETTKIIPLTYDNDGDGLLHIYIDGNEIDFDSTFSWRIDAVNEGRTTTGNIWTFDLLPPIINKMALGTGGNFILLLANRGVFISTDSGDNWERKLPDENESTNWEKGCCNSGGTYIIAVNEDNNIYRSGDVGTSWSQITPADGDTFSVNDMAISSDGQYAIIVGTNSTNPEKSCYLSTDYGETWSVVYPTSSTITWTRCSISDNGKVIGVSASNNFYMSFNSGSSWTERNLPSSAEDWGGLAISGDGKVGIIANTSNNNEVFKNTGWYSKVVIDYDSLTPFARTILDDSDAASVATTIGLGIEDSPEFAGLNLTDFEGIILATDGVISATNTLSLGNSI